MLNTDNVSLSGLTIDYGPFGFMERYDRRFTPNSSDTSGRYKFENQPAIGHVLEPGGCAAPVAISIVAC